MLSTSASSVRQKEKRRHYARGNGGASPTAGLKTDAALAKWIDAGVKYAGSLPPK